VPELKSGSLMPGLEYFDMMDSKQQEIKQREAKLKASKQIKADRNDTDALQRFAFTEIWIERQQHRKRSMQREFTAALDDYFLKDKVQELTLEEQNKGAINKKLFVDSTKVNSIQ